MPEEKRVNLHQKRSKAVFALAKENLVYASKHRNAQFNAIAFDKPIAIGATVLLRYHPPGRNKIQEFWDSTPYRVVDNLQDKVYVIRLKAGSGPLKSVGLREICDLTDRLDTGVPK